MLSELLSMQLAFLLLFVYNRGVIKQQSGNGDGGMGDHGVTLGLYVKSSVGFRLLFETENETGERSISGFFWKGYRLNESVRKTKYLTEAAAAAAIASLLVLLKLLAPFFVFVTMTASPIPIAVICDFHGMKWGFGTSAGVVILVTMIGGPEIGLTTAFYAGALGMAMGYGFLHKMSYGKTLCLTILAYILEMSYKIIFSIYVLGIADALTGAIDRFTTFLRWIWTPLSSVFGFDPDPGKAMFTTSGMVMLGIVFILNAYCYAYLNMEIGGNVLKRLKGGIRG